MITSEHAKVSKSCKQKTRISYKCWKSQSKIEYKSIHNFHYFFECELFQLHFGSEKSMCSTHAKHIFIFTFVPECFFNPMSANCLKREKLKWKRPNDYLKIQSIIFKTERKHRFPISLHLQTLESEKS